LETGNEDTVPLAADGHSLPRPRPREAPTPLKDRVLGILKAHKAYAVTVVVLFTLAIAAGAAEGALNLSNIARYSTPAVFTNRFRAELVVDANATFMMSGGGSSVLDSNRLLVAPLLDSSPDMKEVAAVLLASDIVASALTLNVSDGSPTALISAALAVTATHNVSAANITDVYRRVPAYRNVSVVLSRSSVAPGRTYEAASAWITLLMIVFILALLLNENAVSPDVALMLSLLILQLAGIISVRELLAGFANEGIATVGALYIVALAVGNSGALDLVSRYVLGSPTSISWALARLMVPITILSAFINNTPIVAMMVPVVIAWSERTNIAASKLLIPLSFASILGGTTTLIGTSTNLIVAALAEARDPDIDLSLFGLTPVGVPMAVLGILYMVFVGHRLLPSRESPGQQFRHDPRAYSAHVVIKSDAKQLIGRSLGDAGLRQLTGLFVYSVERPSSGEIFDAPPSTFVLAAGDVIGLAGDVAHVSRLFQVDGLELGESLSKLQQNTGDRHRLVEVVIAQRSMLVGRTPRQVKFRSCFNAAIVGVHRHGDHVVSRIGDVPLQAGDVLLIVTAGSDFLERHRRASAFSLVSEIGVAPVRAVLSMRRIVFCVALTVVMLTLVSIEGTGLSLFTLSLVLGYIFWWTGFVTVEDARNSVDLSVMVMIAASIGLSSAMINSGVALRIGTVLVTLFEPIGELGLLFGVYVTTAMLTAFISNSASVSLVFPIAYVVVQKTVILDLRMVSYCLMLAGSADFMTPIGYQTNLMVYGIGNYRFIDFTKVGVLLQLLCCVTACVLCFYVYRD
jgi:di/tricarboxylate transporter